MQKYGLDKKRFRRKSGVEEPIKKNDNVAA
jgi:hypothetical protein